MSRASGHTAVMADRREAPDSLDFFPTPPWATRALLEHVIGDVSGAPATCWEPAAGEGHMAGVLAEYFADVWRSDVHDYGGLNALGSFVGAGPDVVACPSTRPDWIITNPPFNLAVEFVERALGDADEGVAVLVRTAWLESHDRYERLFRDSPPTIVAPFVERVPMVKGRWDPEASTATAYAWIVWRRCQRLPGQTGPGSWAKGVTTLIWIPPGCRQRLERADDRRRFIAARAAGVTLFGEVAS